MQFGTRTPTDGACSSEALGLTTASVAGGFAGTQRARLNIVAAADPCAPGSLVAEQSSVEFQPQHLRAPSTPHPGHCLPVLSLRYTVRVSRRRECWLYIECLQSESRRTRIAEWENYCCLLGRWTCSPHATAGTLGIGYDIFEVLPTSRALQLQIERRPFDYTSAPYSSAIGLPAFISCAHLSTPRTYTPIPHHGVSRLTLCFLYLSVRASAGFIHHRTCFQ